ncbi:choline/ethanolamine kinase family protein [Legionella sp. km772]|uniref:choline/ethanolamine kinase family protein n=1 Tax=Legionella sp. km772 TaxID=2498111 RepID=UPI000F8F47F1|nr:choline/ethanolamine kinase family protein [Legionella sp. km772]RUR09984.1 hypothetical protein ELY15_08655 [Legionella sp. km772]
MFAFLFKASVNKESDEKLSRKILGYLSSEDIACTLPLVHPTLKKELETTYADLRAVAGERVLIFRKTLISGSLFTSPDSFDYIKLSGGYSNTTYKLSTASSSAYISRIAGLGSDSFIDRRAEWHNASIAAELKLNPKIVFNDEQGNQLSHCLPSPQALTPELLQDNPQYITAVAQQLQTLHQSPRKFHNEFSIFKLNRGFYSRIQDSELTLPEGYAAIQAKTAELAALFAHLDLPSVPCHNDTYYNNFLLSEESLWLIDWEYSGNHDPMWDLAYFADLATLNDAQTTLLLSSYFDCPDFQEKYFLDYLRFISYSLVIKDFLILWTYVQLANNNLTVSEAELLKWSDNALKAGKQILNDENFNKAVLLLENVSQKTLALSH